MLWKADKASILVPRVGAKKLKDSNKATMRGSQFAALFAKLFLIIRTAFGIQRVDFAERLSIGIVRSVPPAIAGGRFDCGIRIREQLAFVNPQSEIRILQSADPPATADGTDLLND